MAPDEILVIKAPKSLSAEQAERLRKELRMFLDRAGLKNRQVMVLAGDIDLTVIKPSSSPANAA